MSLTPYVHLDAPLRGANVGDRIALSAGEAHHLRTVLRLRVGAGVEVADGIGGSAAAELADGYVVLQEQARSTPQPAPTLRIAQALTKGRKLDEVVRQVTELGVDRFTVVAAQRSVTRLEGDKQARIQQRWSAVARAASEQSRRPRRPAVDGPVPTAALTSAAGTLLVAHLGGAPLPAVAARCSDAAEVTLAVGPEGGWTPDEIALLEGAGAITVGLGPTVLRTEHAASAGLAVLAAAFGRWANGAPAHRS